MRKINKFLSVVMSALVLTSGAGECFKEVAFASEKKDATQYISLEDDPLYERYNGNTGSLYSLCRAVPTSLKDITHDTKYKDVEKYYGIDVSKWQGTINWSKVKAAGIDYAIIRLGGRGSSSGTLALDSKFEENMANAKAAGVEIGVYFYTNALTTKEAKEEASYVIEKLKPYKSSITWPVFLDVETSCSRFHEGGVNNKQKTAICKAFCKKIKEEGYTAGLYSYYAYVNSYLNMDDIEDKYYVWIARYNSVLNYSGEYGMWQFTSTGSVDGISGSVDLDVGYVRPMTEVSKKNISVGSISTKTYSGEAFKPSPTLTNKFTGKKMVKGTDYKLTYSNNVNAGTGTVKVTGMGKYEGSMNINFKINKAPATIAVPEVNFNKVYNESAFALKATVTKGNTLNYKSSDTNVVTVSTAVKVTVKNAGEAVITVAMTDSDNYNTPEPVDVKVSVNKAKKTITVGSASVKKKSNSAPFNVNAKVTANEKLTYSSTDKEVVKVDKNGKVTIVGPGVAKIRVNSAATSNYNAAETVSVKVTVAPVATQITKLKVSKTKKAVLYWDKGADITGYEIRYADNKSMNNAKMTRIADKNTTAKVIGKLSQGKKYYFSIRTYKNHNKKDYYSSWSEIKSITI